MPAPEVERRAREWEALHALSTRVAEVHSRREVLSQALTALVETGWFRGGEAWLRDGAAAPGIVARVSADGDGGLAVADGAPGVADGARAVADAALSVGDVEAALPAGPRRSGDWTVVPTAGDAVLVLHGETRVSSSFLGSVAEMVAAAMKRALLHQRLAEKETQRSRLMGALLHAQEEERTRISRDLHDQIGQALTALLIGLDGNLERPDPAAIARLRDLVADTLSDVRRIALDLRPSVLDELGLEAALKRYGREIHERYGLDVNVLITLPSRLSQQEETVLYRVVQEAVTNVVRHAGAGEVSIVATTRMGEVQLVVEDDGTGFDPSALAPEEQIGILGMRERLELLGGSLRLESARGSGCSVHARLPRR